MKNKILKNNNGFALLFSVLVSSLLLTIGLSIFNIALKELSISTATKQSIHAFYAAESGRQYALYTDLIGENSPYLPSDFFSNKGNYLDTSYSQPIAQKFVSVGYGPNFNLVIEKKWEDNKYKKILTTVKSYGYDAKDGNRVERAIEQTY